MFFYAVKCAFSRSEGGPSPAVPWPVPPNDSDVGGTVDDFGVETNQTKKEGLKQKEHNSIKTCIIPINNIYFLFIRIWWWTNKINNIIVIKCFTF
jgi:hypothetical protein